jgi:class 3 adenylate cyclase/tetratricopeptide (TPR) repeat protein
MPSETLQLEAAVTALEAQRELLGDAIVDAALGPLRAKLASLVASKESGIAQQALKQVTILFLDIVGSTSLIQHLDPEAIHAVMDDALSRGTKIVQSHNGKVLQYAGDNLLAVFGADLSTEDDVERAVRCGQVLLELGRTIGAEVLASHSHEGFNFRIGIHTGSVLLGGGVDGEGSIRGIAVNIAARMEQTAPVGGLRISHDSYAHVRGLFEVEVQAPLLVKGVDEPIQSYLVTGTKPRTFRIVNRGFDGVATRMIGRNSELQQLQDSFMRLFSQRKLEAVTVVAEAGMGKSRLRYEFEAWSETRPERFLLFRGQANPQTQFQPFGLLRDILAWRFQILDVDTIPTARAKLEGGIIPLFEASDGAEVAESHAHLLGHLIGIDYLQSPHVKGILSDPKQIRSRAQYAATQLLRRLAAKANSPIVLQIEDLHWADNETLDFLNYVCEVNRDVPILILAFTRPLLLERRNDWGDSGSIHRRIDLHPLNMDERRGLTDELLKKLPQIPAALSELITGRGEGNPFFMEELVWMLIDQGAIQTGGANPESWSLDAEKLLSTHVPSSLTGVLQARIDDLTADERLTLQQASVIGEVFWDQALWAIDSQARICIPALVKRGLILPRRYPGAIGADDGLREYVFKQSMLCRVTYGTVLKRHKIELHAKVADWLAKLNGARALDFLGLTAEHYARAGDVANATEYFTRAAENAKICFAHNTALNFVASALNLLGQRAGEVQTSLAIEPSLHWRLLDVRERTFELQGQREAQRADLKLLEELAETLNDDSRRAVLAWRRGQIALRSGDFRGLESTARRTMTLSEHAGDEELRLKGMRLLAIAMVELGNISEGHTIARTGLVAARRSGFRRIESNFLNNLALLASQQGDMVTFLEISKQCLSINQELGDRVNAGINMGNVGEALLTLGQLALAQQELEGAIQICKTLGDLTTEGQQCSRLSRLALIKGDKALALAHANEACGIARTVQAVADESLALYRLGEAELALGHYSQAAAAFELAESLARELGTSFEHAAAAGRARVSLAVGDRFAAMGYLENLFLHLTNGETIEGKFEQPYIEFTCFQVLFAVGDSRSAGFLRRSYTALQSRATAITDPAMRYSFLTNIPEHRTIVAAWEKQCSPEAHP